MEELADKILIELNKLGEVDKDAIADFMSMLIGKWKGGRV